MSRKDRIIYDGAIYHIYQRGNNKEFIFRDSRIKQFLIETLVKYNKKFDYEILAYVIMDNHYHLLMKTNKSSISEIMFYVNNVLAKYINNLLNRSGHAFENRYKCKLVDTDGYLIWLLRYIHRNPVKARICKNVEEYKWSSNCYYQHSISSNINAMFILNMLGENKKMAMQRYLKLINTIGDEEDMNKDYEMTEDLLKPYALVSERNDTAIKNEFIKPYRKNMEQILETINVSDSILEDIRKGKRKRNLTPIKLQITRKAMEECYTVKEISDFLNVVPSAISKLLSRSKIS
ncbi:transposase [Clostridium oryzae]|uniref:Transposase IS200 like protein n=1 Tax=Clostridium oryzae TaxID=1450648 RepID=A0A1V4IYD0_9CLOT|nr:transposase [Clostridium oryzae]OPJ64909.1 transposase IS200 like protein [Clostridium oryzae]